MLKSMSLWTLVVFWLVEIEWSVCMGFYYLTRIVALEKRNGSNQSTLVAISLLKHSNGYIWFVIEHCLNMIHWHGRDCILFCGCKMIISIYPSGGWVYCSINVRVPVTVSMIYKKKKNLSSTTANTCHSSVIFKPFWCVSMCDDIESIDFDICSRCLQKVVYSATAFDGMTVSWVLLSRTVIENAPPFSVPVFFLYLSVQTC